MLQALFQKQQAALNQFFALLNVEAIEPVFKKILNCQGVIFLTGIGKSGFIAQKIAATLVSTGTKAFFLSAVDALHGDLGIVSANDIFLIISKSGESEELLNILPFIRNKSVTVIGVTSNSESRLAKGSDHVVYLPCPHELCPFDLAPTISSEIQLLFGDVLSIALMNAKKFTLQDFAKNHPGGRIGRRMAIKVKDLMLNESQTPFCLPEDLLEEVLIDFTNKRCGCLLVIDEEKKLKGIFTDGDLRRCLQSKGEHVLKESIKNLMGEKPKVIDQEALAWDALKLMEEDQKHPVMVLPVLDVEKNRVVGIIKMHDIIQAGL